MVVQGSTTTAILPILPTLPPSSFTTTYKKSPNQQQKKELTPYQSQLNTKNNSKFKANIASQLYI